MRPVIGLLIMRLFFCVCSEASISQIVGNIVRSSWLIRISLNDPFDQMLEVWPGGAVGTAVSPDSEQLPGCLFTSSLVEVACVPILRQLPYLDECSMVVEVGRIGDARLEYIDLHPLFTGFRTTARSKGFRQRCLTDLLAHLAVQEVTAEPCSPGEQVQFLLIVVQARPGGNERWRESNDGGSREEHRYHEDNYGPAVPSQPRRFSSGHLFDTPQLSGDQGQADSKDNRTYADGKNVSLLEHTVRTGHDTEQESGQSKYHDQLADHTEHSRTPSDGEQDETQGDKNGGTSNQIAPARPANLTSPEEDGRSKCKCEKDVSRQLQVLVAYRKSHDSRIANCGE